MKFALHLRENLVPEWRVKYLDYKGGKKRLKKIVKLLEDEDQVKQWHRGQAVMAAASKPICPAQEPSSEVLDELAGLPPSIADQKKQDLAAGKGANSPAEDGSGSRLSPDADNYGAIERTKTNVSLQLPPPALKTDNSSAVNTSIHKVHYAGTFPITDRSPLLNPLQSDVMSEGEITRSRSYFRPFDMMNMGSAALHPEVEFVQWVDDQVRQINEFYIEKEEEAVDRYLILQDQLIRMLEHRKQAKGSYHNTKATNPLNEVARSTGSAIVKKVDLPSLPVRLRHLRKNGKEDSTHHHGASESHVVDYERKDEDTVSYISAKRQLKLATAEYYRSLELLKGYRALNYTAIRKIVKKFDKLTHNSICEKYLEKLNGLEFVKSDILDNLLVKTENLYASYFEDGNHKSAVEKLRAKEFPEQHYTDMFTIGLFLGLSVPLFVYALVTGIQHLGHPERPDTSYLFQIWGGFFIVILMLNLFTINLMIWKKQKINYPFVFEFDPRYILDPCQYGVIPAILMFLLSVFGWFTFNDFFPTTFPARYFPCIYLGICVAVFVVPLPIFQWRSRRWLFISCWRLLLSGLYPVEFKDFFMGDIFCSLNYSLSNASFFFCLYATDWINVYPGSPTTSRCSSSKSRLLGFLNCLPGIWRFLQCIRRFLDTGDWFPHLANAAKYSCLILYYMFLSLLRIDRGESTPIRAMFILFASLNSVYSSFWDIIMDWSLGQTDTENTLLRDELAYPKVYYYIMMVLDPIMRFSWVLYAAYYDQIQQSAKISFIVALIEIIRRFLWVFFRVENEHCANVGRFRASRDLTLPYAPARPRQSLSKRKRSRDSFRSARRMRSISLPRATTEPVLAHPHIEEGLETIPRYVEPSLPHEPSPLKRRETLASLATPVIRAASQAFRDAHVRDFQRRRADPFAEVDDFDHDYYDPEYDDEDDDDDDDDGEEVVSENAENNGETAVNEAPDRNTEEAGNDHNRRDQPPTR
ncbi:hypothetical protein TRVA0_006S00386 [Trichomonascus vanleenenianus]|uniref:Syg1p n=1 Tax=Trichomonascus vanleenenianus TaxID=2268995 RepID=UPI003EC97AE1